MSDQINDPVPVMSIPKVGTKDRIKYDLLTRSTGATLDEINRAVGHNAWSYINDTKRLAKRCGGIPQWDDDGGGRRRFWIARQPEHERLKGEPSPPLSGPASDKFPQSRRAREAKEAALKAIEEADSKANGGSLPFLPPPPRPNNHTPTSGTIFISYRREESAGFAGRIFDRLAFSFSREQVFMDVDNIEPGVDFVDVLNERVGVCKAFLAVIGPNWESATTAHGQRRLDDPHDFVRIEIEAALKRKIRVIPILLAGSRMPRPAELPETMQALTRRQAFEVSHKYFNRDLDELIRVLKPMISASDRPARK